MNLITDKKSRKYIDTHFTLIVDHLHFSHLYKTKTFTKNSESDTPDKQRRIRKEEDRTTDLYATVLNLVLRFWYVPYRDTTFLHLSIVGT